MTIAGSLSPNSYNTTTRNHVNNHHHNNTTSPSNHSLSVIQQNLHQEVPPPSQSQPSIVRDQRSGSNATTPTHNQNQMPSRDRSGSQSSILSTTSYNTNILPFPVFHINHN